MLCERKNVKKNKFWRKVLKSSMVLVWFWTILVVFWLKVVGNRWVLIDFEIWGCGSALVRFFLPRIPIDRDELARKLLAGNLIPIPRYPDRSGSSRSGSSRSGSSRSGSSRSGLNIRAKAQRCQGEIMNSEQWIVNNWGRRLFLFFDGIGGIICGMIWGWVSTDFEDLDRMTGLTG